MDIEQIKATVIRINNAHNIVVLSGILRELNVPAAIADNLVVKAESLGEDQLAMKIGRKSIAHSKTCCATDAMIKELSSKLEMFINLKLPGGTLG